ncbi:hypothetical protein BH10CYA1_BH10CYA1_60510 [soil metagenome]
MLNNFSSNRALKFPNARLFVHNQLSCGRAASEAIARSACEYGLLSQDELVDIIPTTSVAPCPCMATVRNIVAKYCEIKKKQPNQCEINEENLWKVLSEDAQSYFDGSSAVTQSEIINQNPHECARFAPALFDLMLQELSRHPG